MSAFVLMMLALLMIRGTDPNNNEATKENSIGPQKYLTTLTSKKRKEKAPPDQESNDPYFDPEMKKLMDQLDVRVPSRDELEKYITKSNNNAEAMIAAGIILNDSSYFIRALENSPNDVHALYCLALNESTDESMKIDLAKKLLKEQPDNAIASYLLASLQAESGNIDESIDTLLDTFDQKGYDDFYNQTSLKVEDALRGTGSSKSGSALYSLWNVPVPILSKINESAKTVMALVPKSDPERAQELRSLVASIGAKVCNEDTSIINELVGLSAQIKSLEGMEEDAISHFENLSVEEARKSLEQRKNSIRDLTLFGPQDFITMDPALIESYMNRVRTVGEYEATKWLMERTKKEN
ncbi:MAG: hypothetical protein VX407_04320, partial [Verrucomicrobiota bacterium]|nr:hypothetical protein [Verrucomicrobiota bacterium]